MAFGTLLAAWPGRWRRRPTDAVSAPVQTSLPEPEPAVLEPRRSWCKLMDKPDPGSDYDLDVPSGGPRTALVAAAMIAVLVALLVAVLATRDPSTARASQSPLIGRLAPATAGTTLAGEQVSIDQHRGRWVMVNFFASWCTPCIEEHPELAAFDAAHRAKGDAVLIAVTFDDRSDDARKFFAERGGGWPVIDDPENSIGVAYGVAQVPETFVIAPNGTVVQRFAGAVTRTALDQVIAAYEDPPA